ncbi:MAG: energy transducer TonB [Altibacter sp.]|uniref:energy transducer TonB n=1 Tax=Altibacter sp. TaxID=2024823 RepID=UPI001D89B084|nr:energy transducer TonB [Altibacter sp.]MBZ0328195.1 energy transducer TonB [Altibacter sp.]
MNKKILLVSIALITLTLMAYGFNCMFGSKKDQAVAVNSNSVPADEQIEQQVIHPALPAFSYVVGTRFNSISKTDLQNAKSFSDFIAKEHADRIVSYASLSVITLKDGNQTDSNKTTNSGVFSAAQLALLQSFDYSANILISAKYTEKSFETGELQQSIWTPYLTVVPEKQAVYTTGKEALLDYLKENSKEQRVMVQKNRLKPARLNFTITKNGAVSNAKIVRTSGYSTIDSKMIELINNMPDSWEAAENAKGEKVDQELVFSFGADGC